MNIIESKNDAFVV